MFNVKKIKIEYKSGAVLGAVGLIFSLLLGFISGNSLNIIFFRVMVFTVLFSFLGFTGLWVIKKYVPEVYQVFNDVESNAQNGKNSISAESINADVTDDLSNVPLQQADLAGDNSDSSFQPGIEAASIQKDNTLDRDLSDVDGSINEEIFSNPSEGINQTAQKLLNNKNLKYEPKIAAQAIRTMLKRDQ